MYKVAFIYFILLLLVVSCRQKQDTSSDKRMQQWEAIMETNPEAVRDSLQSINSEKLAGASKAYYSLLKTISDDKTYVDFLSDSLIKETESYYHKHANKSNLHIRSLVYLSIVRSRLGMTDSTVLVPLKEAEIIFEQQNEQNPSIGYLLNYFLGEVHHENSNFSTASKYFKRALQFSKEENNSAHTFDSYMAMFWNSMKHEEFNEGKEYLDTLEMLSSKDVNDKYFLLNAQSVYYDTQNMYEKSLEKEKEMLLLAPFVKGSSDIFRLYYSISEQYFNINQLDSSKVYGIKAIESITDSTYQLNYLLYENVARIAESQKDYQLANHYLNYAALVRENTIEKEKDVHILELEKQYDLSQSENKALKAESKNRISIIIILCLIILLIVSVFYIQTRKIKASQKLKMADEEKRKIEIEKRLVEAQANVLRIENERKQLAENIYSLMLNQFFSIENQLRSIGDKSRRTKPDFADFIEETRASLTKNLVEEFAQNISEAKFYELTGISLPENKINKNEILMLFLIHCGVSNNNLASVFRTSTASIRSRKNQLKNKMLLLNIENPFFI